MSVFITEKVDKYIYTPESTAFSAYSADESHANWSSNSNYFGNTPHSKVYDDYQVKNAFNNAISYRPDNMPMTPSFNSPSRDENNFNVLNNSNQKYDFENQKPEIISYGAQDNSFGEIDMLNKLNSIQDNNHGSHINSNMSSLTASNQNNFSNNIISNNDNFEPNINNLSPIEHSHNGSNLISSTNKENHLNKFQISPITEKNTPQFSFQVEQEPYKNSNQSTRTTTNSENYFTSILNQTKSLVQNGTSYQNFNNGTTFKSKYSLGSEFQDQSSNNQASAFMSDMGKNSRLNQSDASKIMKNLNDPGLSLKNKHRYNNGYNNENDEAFINSENQYRFNRTNMTKNNSQTSNFISSNMENTNNINSNNNIPNSGLKNNSIANDSDEAIFFDTEANSPKETTPIIFNNQQKEFNSSMRSTQNVSHNTNSIRNSSPQSRIPISVRSGSPLNKSRSTSPFFQQINPPKSFLHDTNNHLIQNKSYLSNTKEDLTSGYIHDNDYISTLAKQKNELTKNLFFQNDERNNNNNNLGNITMESEFDLVQQLGSNQNNSTHNFVKEINNPIPMMNTGIANRESKLDSMNSFRQQTPPKTTFEYELSNENLGSEDPNNQRLTSISNDLSNEIEHNFSIIQENLNENIRNIHSTMVNQVVYSDDMKKIKATLVDFNKKFNSIEDTLKKLDIKTDNQQKFFEEEHFKMLQYTNSLRDIISQLTGYIENIDQKLLNSAINKNSNTPEQASYFKQKIDQFDSFFNEINNHLIHLNSVITKISNENNDLKNKIDSYGSNQDLIDALNSKFKLTESNLNNNIKRLFDEQIKLNFNNSNNSKNPNYSNTSNNPNTSNNSLMNTNLNFKNINSNIENFLNGNVSNSNYERVSPRNTYNISNKESILSNNNYNTNTNNLSTSNSNSNQPPNYNLQKTNGNEQISSPKKLRKVPYHSRDDDMIYKNSDEIEQEYIYKPSEVINTTHPTYHHLTAQVNPKENNYDYPVFANNKVSNYNNNIYAQSFVQQKPAPSYISSTSTNETSSKNNYSKHLDNNISTRESTSYIKIPDNKPLSALEYINQYDENDLSILIEKNDKVYKHTVNSYKMAHKLVSKENKSVPLEKNLVNDDSKKVNIKKSDITKVHSGNPILKYVSGYNEVSEDENDNIYDLFEKNKKEKNTSKNSGMVFEEEDSEEIASGLYTVYSVNEKKNIIKLLPHKSKNIKTQPSKSFSISYISFDNQVGSISSKSYPLLNSKNKNVNIQVEVFTFKKEKLDSVNNSNDEFTLVDSKNKIEDVFTVNKSEFILTPNKRDTIKISFNPIQNLSQPNDVYYGILNIHSGKKSMVILLKGKVNQSIQSNLFVSHSFPKDIHHTPHTFRPPQPKFFNVSPPIQQSSLPQIVEIQLNQNQFIYNSLNDQHNLVVYNSNSSPLSLTFTPSNQYISLNNKFDITSINLHPSSSTIISIRIHSPFTTNSSDNINGIPVFHIGKVHILGKSFIDNYSNLNQLTTSSDVNLYISEAAYNSYMNSLNSAPKVTFAYPEDKRPTMSYNHINPPSISHSAKSYSASGHASIHTSTLKNYNNFSTLQHDNTIESYHTATNEEERVKEKMKVYFGTQELNFGVIQVDSILKKKVLLYNLTNKHITLNFSGLQQPFYISKSKIELKPQTSTSIQIKFEPTKQGNFFTNLIATSSDNFYKTSVYISGESFN